MLKLYARGAAPQKEKYIVTKSKIITVFVLALAMTCGIFIGCSCTPTEEAAAVLRISVLSAPTQTEYYIDEEFSAKGGRIKVFYDDDTTEELDMTDERVTFDPPVSTAKGDDKDLEDGKWQRTAIVKFGGKSAMFNIYVAHEKFTVTFDYNYDDKTETEAVNKGYCVGERTPERSGNWAFDAWYTDSGFADEYDFDTPVTDDLTLYANWLDTTRPTVQFTFDIGYYGIAIRRVVRTLEQGSTVAKISDPKRTDYEFSGWFTAQTGGSVYDFSNPVTQNTTVYGQWRKTKTGTSTYVFEAEHVDLTGKYGPGISGTGNEGSMVVGDSQNKGASNGKYLSFLYAEHSATIINFNLACDETISDATIVFRLSAEVESWTMTTANYTFMLNNSILDYAPIAFTDVPPMVSADTPGMLPFKDYTIGVNVALAAGVNTFTLITNNSDPYVGTTMEAHAPLVDCLKITTSAVVIWDGTYGLPMSW